MEKTASDIFKKAKEEIFDILKRKINQIYEVDNNKSEYTIFVPSDNLVDHVYILGSEVPPCEADIYDGDPDFIVIRRYRNGDVHIVDQYGNDRDLEDLPLSLERIIFMEDQLENIYNELVSKKIEVSKNHYESTYFRRHLYN